MFFFSFDILERAAFTEAIAAKAAFAKALDNSVNRMLKIVGPQISELAAIHYEHVEEIELLAVWSLTNSKFL